MAAGTAENSLFSKEEAEPFAAIASQKGYQVLRFDLPVHGERKCETDTFYPGMEAL